MFYQENWISMMLYNTEFRSAGAFITVEPDQHCHTTLDPNQQEMSNQKTHMSMMLEKLDPDQQMLYKKNRINMMLYDTGS